MKPRTSLLLVIVVAIVAVLLRVMPHQANMAAMGALALVAGIYAPGLMAFAIPLVAIVVSDTIIGFYSPSIMAAVYMSYILMIGLGMLVRHTAAKRSALSRGALGIGAAAVGSLLFFALTNAAVWQWGSMYQPTLNGLLQSYVNALPFLRNSMTSDIAYTVIFMTSVEVAMHSALFQTKTKHATLGSA